MQRTFHRDRFTWLAYLSLAFYGYFLNVLGPITPFLKEELRLSYTVSSFHFTAFAVGIRSAYGVVVLLLISVFITSQIAGRNSSAYRSVI